MTTKITEQNISNLANAGVNWQPVVTADGSTVISLEAGKGYFINTTSAVGLVSLPTSPNVGDTIAIKDYAGTFATNNLTIGRNGNNIQGVANNSLISTNRASLTLVYVDATKGWLYAVESNVADLGAPTFISATGGTITTSGDFKIHSFTGDGCFVVATVGNPVGGPSVVDYLVVAGGGGGQGEIGGGGGAGGYRESHSTPVSGCYSASPLASPTGITLTTQTYPITVGAGGSGGTGPNSSPTAGSNSVFSTITSAGGGSSTTSSPFPAGGDGGSGSGGGHQTSGGAGNTPPTSPPQGNAGGNSGYAASGGGGASAAGTNGSTPGPGGAGGAGTSTSITASPVSYAGGGGGGAYNPGVAGGASPCGTGGAGIPGTGGNSAGPSNNGTTNRGGGGGGNGETSNSGNAAGSGGSGIVIIRYKFQ